MLDPRQREAQLYDVTVADWPGEVAFYQGLAAAAQARGQAVLEIGCGTGRIALRLAQAGVQVVGLDKSPEMLAVAQAKSGDLLTLRWVQADMRDFDLQAHFGLIILPGHVFQHMLTPDAQVAALTCIRRHLAAGGVLVVHLDHQELDWLGALTQTLGGVFEPSGEVLDPVSGRRVCTRRAWWYAPATQTASTVAQVEEYDAQDRVVARWETELLPLHCVFRYEMEHLLGRVGFAVQAVYGDFLRGPLVDTSSEMVWVATTH
jgi:SAM-dependent methyltransferase